jgi:hypothetical protein
MSEHGIMFRQMERGTVVIACVLLASGVTACAGGDVANGDDPIAALDAPVRSTRYDGAYWQQQRVAGSDVWRRALDVCSSERATERPNCEPVVANRTAEQGNTRADSVLRAAGQAVKTGGR